MREEDGIERHIMTIELARKKGKRKAKDEDN